MKGFRRFFQHAPGYNPGAREDTRFGLLSRIGEEDPLQLPLRGGEGLETCVAWLSGARPCFTLRSGVEDQDTLKREL